MWTKSRATNGYGQVRVGSKIRKTHRVMWESIHGAVPPMLQLDHLCRNRACCNPLHLEVVSRSENIRRGIESAPAFQRNKTHCARGHEYSEENTYVRPDGGRNCRQCGMKNAREYRKKERV